VNTEQDPDFDRTIGQLDFILSKMMIFSKQSTLSEPNRQTLKHHAEDMEAAAHAILKRLGATQEGTPQPAYGAKDGCQAKPTPT
jgi:hypothetical protein